MPNILALLLCRTSRISGLIIFNHATGSRNVEIQCQPVVAIDRILCAFQLLGDPPGVLSCPYDPYQFHAMQRACACGHGLDAMQQPRQAGGDAGAAGDEDECVASPGNVTGDAAVWTLEPRRLIGVDVRLGI